MHSHTARLDEAHRLAYLTRHETHYCAQADFYSVMLPVHTHAVIDERRKNYFVCIYTCVCVVGCCGGVDGWMDGGWVCTYINIRTPPCWATGRPFIIKIYEFLTPMISGGGVQDGPKAAHGLMRAQRASSLCQPGPACTPNT